MPKTSHIFPQKVKNTFTNKFQISKNGCSKSLSWRMAKILRYLTSSNSWDCWVLSLTLIHGCIRLAALNSIDNACFFWINLWYYLRLQADPWSAAWSDSCRAVWGFRKLRPGRAGPLAACGPWRAEIRYPETEKEMLNSNDRLLSRK